MASERYGPRILESPEEILKPAIKLQYFLCPFRVLILKSFRALTSAFPPNDESDIFPGQKFVGRQSFKISLAHINFRPEMEATPFSRGHLERVRRLFLVQNPKILQNDD